MFKKSFLFLFTILIAFSGVYAEAAKDIPIDQLPAEVKTVFEQYINILRNSGSLKATAEKFKEIAGGSLINEAGDLRSTVPDMSLKKDYKNIKHYANPIKITRVNLSSTNGDGYGKTAIKGKVYKIWIDKDDRAKGMPAPVTLVVPEDHPTITTPKVTNIGSY